ncbi:hypothetical protein TWF696_008934 [Orbilia brochopaga]|uniref:Nitronate monooxygenase domain-containing protein n=1 Tax=Orbilia brochopaga TaxID=3140254 RepID=A0AAV9UGY2_9PEZI
MVVIINNRPDTVQGPLKTPFTEYFNVKHPICLAGMNIGAGPKLGAAVIEAGGFACLGGNGYIKAPEYSTMSYAEFIEEFISHQTPEKVRTQIHEMKSFLKNPLNVTFGIDILLPKVGGSARRTNYDYTEGTAEKIIDVVIEEGGKMFISALGVPEPHLVDRLHRGGVLVGGNIGHPRHVQKVLDAGCDMIIAQGGEGGGHTGDVPSMLLLPMVLELCKGRVSKFTGRPIIVLAAGGIYNSRGLAAALAMGADGVWCGTRFVAATESGASDGHQKAVLETTVSGTARSTIYTGRPMRVQQNAYVAAWEKEPAKITALTQKGVVPINHDLDQLAKSGKPVPAEMDHGMRPILLGQAAGAITEILPAKAIIDEMVYGTLALMKRCDDLRSKL